MTMIIGTRSASPDGTTCELRLFHGDAHIASFLNSAFPKVQVEDSANKIPYCAGELTVDTGVPVGFVRQGAKIEIWVADSARPAHRMFAGLLEYIEASTNEGSPTTIHFEARGLAATLMDATFRGELGDTLEKVVASLAAASGLRADTDYAPTAVTVWLNARSSYAVLRLLAANLGAVIRVREDVVGFLSYEAVARRAAVAPRVKLSSADVKSSRLVQGRRIKKS